MRGIVGSDKFSSSSSVVPIIVGANQRPSSRNCLLGYESKKSCEKSCEVERGDCRKRKGTGTNTWATARGPAELGPTSHANGESQMFAAKRHKKFGGLREVWNPCPRSWATPLILSSGPSGVTCRDFKPRRKNKKGRALLQAFTGVTGKLPLE